MTRWFSVCESLVRRAVPSHRADDVCGDLLEEYTNRMSRGSSVTANVWLTLQAIAFLSTPFVAGEFRQRPRRRFVGGLLQDVRVAMRSYRRSLGFTLVASVTMALGVGGNVAVFSLIEGVLLRPLSFEDADDLVAIRETLQGQEWWSAAPVNVVEWRRRSNTLRDIAYTQPQNMTFDPGGAARQIAAVGVSANFLRTLRTHPHMGRTFVPGEDRPGASPTIMLTHAFWTAEFGAADVLGRSLRLDGVPHEIVGILPEGWSTPFLAEHDLLVPRPFTPAELSNRGRILQAIARLGPGISLTAAQSELDEIARAIDAEAPSGARGWGVHLVSLHEQVVGNVRTVLWLLLCAVGFVLLIACANLSNLLLARGTTRHREFATRAALGSGRWRLTQQVLTESTMLGLVGGLLGLGLASIALTMVSRIDPTSLPRLEGVRVNWIVFGFSVLVAGGSGAIAGLLPALRVGKGHLTSLRSASMGGEAGRGLRARDYLMAGEIALVLILLAGAAAAVSGFRDLRRVDPGFVAPGRVIVELTVPTPSGTTPADVAREFRALVSDLREVPDVLHAGSITNIPFLSNGWTAFQVVESQPVPEPGDEPTGGMEGISPGYFDTMGIPVLAGRDFDDRDHELSSRVAIVDQTMVDKFWPDRSPIGDRVRLGPLTTPFGEWFEVVGVVGAVRYQLDADPRPRLYIPDGQIRFLNGRRFITLHTLPGAELALLGALESTVQTLGPRIPPKRLTTLDDLAATSVSRPRLQTTLLSMFSAVALLLGAVGVYGVVSFGVNQRKREICMRMALGASPATLHGMILRQMLMPLTLGVTLGILGIFMLSRIATTWMTAATPDPERTAVVTGFLCIVVLGATVLPTTRATRTVLSQGLRM